MPEMCTFQVGEFDLKRHINNVTFEYQVAYSRRGGSGTLAKREGGRKKQSGEQAKYLAQ